MDDFKKNKLMHATNIPAFLLLYPKRKALHRNGLEFIAQLLSLFGMIFKILHASCALYIQKYTILYECGKMKIYLFA